MKYLFIGGSLDGQWREVDPQHCGQVMVHPKIPVRTPDALEAIIGDALHYRTKMQIEGYFVQYLEDQDGEGNRVRSTVFVFDGESGLIARLLANYRPGESVEVEATRIHPLDDATTRRINQYLCGTPPPHRVTVLLPKEGA